MFVLTRGKAAFVQMPPEFKEDGDCLTEFARDGLKQAVESLCVDQPDLPTKIICDKGIRTQPDFYFQISFGYKFEVNQNFHFNGIQK